MMRESQKKRAKKLFHLFYYILLGFLILTVVLFVGSKLPIPGNYSLMTVMSGSMTPAIKIGSLVVVKPFESYSIGDVVTFGGLSKGQLPITHRIMEAEVVGGRTLFTTKGDANASPDPQKIEKKEIFGKVLFSLPFFGYVVDFVRKPVGFLVVIGLPAAIIVGDEIRKIWQELKKGKAQNH